MTYADFKNQVAQAGIMLDAMRDNSALNITKVDLDLAACECAAKLAGYDLTSAKMLNKTFREDAAKAAFEIATRKTA